MKVRKRQLDLVHTTVGPRHDPYAREELIVDLNELRINYRRCSLAGDSLWVNKGEVQSDNPGATFQRLTGLTTRQFYKYYERNWEPDPFGPPSRYE